MRLTRQLAAFVVLALSSLACVCGSPPVPGQGPQSAGPRAPIAATGPASWTIDGQTYEINSTYYLVLDGEGQYVAEWLVPEGTDIPHEDAAAQALAAPLLRHIVREGLHRRQNITGVGTGPVEIEWIGVALMRRSGFRTAGYRVRRRVAEIEAETR